MRYITWLPFLFLLSCSKGDVDKVVQDGGILDPPSMEVRRNRPITFHDLGLGIPVFYGTPKIEAPINQIYVPDMGAPDMN